MDSPSRSPLHPGDSAYMESESDIYVQSPPPYDDTINLAYSEGAELQDDGRIEVDLDSGLSRTLSKLTALPPPSYASIQPAESNLFRNTHDRYPVCLNVVIQVVGSRGDVQPFVALGEGLKLHGHRVRLATHVKFRDFVLQSGLEFFPIGGDPEELMLYMVKNPGLIPSMQSLRAGVITRKRAMIAGILEGCWQSCIASDPISDAPFVADAIIANPPSFAHIHCAEALGIPVHMMFTMPWTGTRAFPHPLANLRPTSKSPDLANYLSYVVVEWLTWQGLGDVINAWRLKMDLEPIPSTEGPMLSKTLKIPFTYCWSPSLIPKPADWPANIDVCGFFFRSPPQYQPPKHLDAFLAAGPPPVYIGFGSIVVADPARLSSIILDAVSACGVRAIISRGWSRLDGPERDDIFWLDDCPHEWLFQHVSAVIHHGGAGTTACGLRFARPTAIVPYFGDQPFWGNMVAVAGAGPKPIPHRKLDAHNLAEAIRFCLTEGAHNAACAISARMKSEDGVQNAIRSFYANLPLKRLQCDLLPDQPAVWTVKAAGKRMNISKLAAEVLIADMRLKAEDLRIHRSNPIHIENRRWEPVSGTVSSLLGTGTGMADATAGIVFKPYAEYTRARKLRETLAAKETPNTAPISGIQSAESDSVDEDIESSESLPTTRETFSTRSTEDGATKRGTETKAAGHPVARAMALASAKSLGKFFITSTKGMLIDMPLATAEGLRCMPALWGGEVKDYGTVVDWKSGAAVAGRSFAFGIADGCRDLVTRPVEGAEAGGVWGAVIGAGQGSASLLGKTVGASLGLVAYPGQGIAKSVHSAMHRETKKSVVAARLAEGCWMAMGVSGELREAVLTGYRSSISG